MKTKVKVIEASGQEPRAHARTGLLNSTLSSWSLPMRLVPFLVLAACAADIRDTDSGGNLDDTDTDTDTYTDVRTVEIDATDSTAWVHYAFEGGLVSPSDPWTLAFQRYTVKVDGGSSGDGGVEVAVLDGADFDALTEAPDSGWTTDAETGLVFDSWYDYDGTTHVLTAADQVFVVREGDGDTFKLEFLDYYDDAGNAGHPSFRWAAL